MSVEHGANGLLPNYMSSGGKFKHQMLEPSQTFGVSVTVKMDDNKKVKLNSSIASLWALSMTGVAVAVAHPRSPGLYITIIFYYTLLG